MDISPSFSLATAALPIKRMGRNHSHQQSNDNSFYFNPSNISWLGTNGASVRLVSNHVSLPAGTGLLKSFGPARSICWLGKRGASYFTSTGFHSFAGLVGASSAAFGADFFKLILAAGASTRLNTTPFTFSETIEPRGQASKHWPHNMHDSGSM